MRQIRLTGHDDLNKFRITRRQHCDVCGKRRVICIIYLHAKPDYGLCHCLTPRHAPAHEHDDTCPFKLNYDVPVYRMLTWQDLLLHSILGKAYQGKGVGALGIQCGCYAKFHRQITHIAEAVQKKIEVQSSFVGEASEVPTI